MNAVPTAIGNCDGYGVETPVGVVGWVEEMWLDDRDDPTALAVRLLDGRRGLLVQDQITEVSHDHRAVTIASDARILQLEPPHVQGNGGTPVASWAASGAALELPEPAGLVRGAFAGLHRPPVPKAPEDAGDSTLRTILAMFIGIAIIGVAVIALDILVAYAVTGHPPY
jgi:hypothetical protein